MTSVKNVYITQEVAEELGLNPSYLIKLAKTLKLNDDEMRATGKRGYLFSKEAVEKLRQRKQQ